MVEDRINRGREDEGWTELHDMKLEEGEERMPWRGEGGREIAVDQRKPGSAQNV